MQMMHQTHIAQHFLWMVEKQEKGIDGGGSFVLIFKEIGDMLAMQEFLNGAKAAGDRLDGDNAVHQMRITSSLEAGDRYWW